MPAPKGNLNAAKNGSRLPLRRLTVGEFPAPLNFVKIEARQYRRAMEQAVLDADGEITVTAAHAIDTAAAAVAHGGICRWLLREKIDKMTTADILATSRELLKSKETRDRAVRLLKLDAGSDPRSLIDSFYTEDANFPDDPTDVPEKAREGAIRPSESDSPKITPIDPPVPKRKRTFADIRRQVNERMKGKTDETL